VSQLDATGKIIDKHPKELKKVNFFNHQKSKVVVLKKNQIVKKTGEHFYGVSFITYQCQMLHSVIWDFKDNFSLHHDIIRENIIHQFLLLI
jgi:hypothetical protein